MSQPPYPPPGSGQPASGQPEPGPARGTARDWQQSAATPTAAPGGRYGAPEPADPYSANQAAAPQPSAPQSSAPQSAWSASPAPQQGGWNSSGGGAQQPAPQQSSWSASTAPQYGAPQQPGQLQGSSQQGSSQQGSAQQNPGWGSAPGAAPSAWPAQPAPEQPMQGWGGPPSGPGGPSAPGGAGGGFGGGVTPSGGESIAAPNLINGATVHGLIGQRGIRHPQEFILLAICAVVVLAAEVIWVWLTVKAFSGWLRTGDWIVNLGVFSALANYYFIIGGAWIVVWIARALNYATLRARAVRMSPTQFPQGYRMVVEAAKQQGLRRVPDAYVQVGNGTINAFASGHGFRRFVLVTSDLFEVGGKVRDPDALRFVIAHEVGHLAAGHVSYFRLLVTSLISNVPILGTALSRAQEYTADNFGYQFCPQGGLGTMAVLGAGKYLNADVNVNELADRAATEKGFWLHVANWTSSHPITTWRAYALRDRSRPGKIWKRPKLPQYFGVMPPGRLFTKDWPTPQAALDVLDQADAQRPAGLDNQFGRFPGADYAGQPSMRQVQEAQPLLSRRVETIVLPPPPQQPPTTQPPSFGTWS